MKAEIKGTRLEITAQTHSEAVELKNWHGQKYLAENKEYETMYDWAEIKNDENKDETAPKQDYKLQEIRMKCLEIAVDKIGIIELDRVILYASSFYRYIVNGEGESKIT